MATVVKTIAIFTARSEKTEAVKGLLLGMLRPSREEPGNLRWDVWQDPIEPRRFMVDELYSDDAAVAMHRETPHYQHYATAIKDVADRIVVTVHPVEVA
jgi:quinol monooxygenase YgiN